MPGADIRPLGFPHSVPGAHWYHACQQSAEDPFVGSPGGANIRPAPGGIDDDIGATGIR
jgi:hypothetical protein